MISNAEVATYIKKAKSGEFAICDDQKALIRYIEKCFCEEDIYIDEILQKKYLDLQKYFPFERLFEWEELCLTLHLCTFWRDSGMPRWPDMFLFVGRGAGKDGYIAFASFCLLSPHSGLKRYDVDICANVEEQAMRPMNDVIDVLDDERQKTKLEKHFYKTREKVTGLKNKGTMRGRTNNPKSRDGMRSGIVVFNEIHQYQDYSNIKVFITGLGKTKHPRRLYATTNGDVREGPLDDILARSEAILKGKISDGGLLPFICRLDDKEEASNPAIWEKANPSLRYLPDLRLTVEKEFWEWKQNPAVNADFMTKRMNLPQSAADVAVTDWENIAATNRPLPDLSGWECTVGVDYASVGDWVSVNLHFRKGDLRYDINHSWMCLKSKDLPRLTAPWREWAAAEYLTLVDDVEIHPDLPCEWIYTQGIKYQIRVIALDNFRYALFSASLRNIGFDANDFENVKLVRPSDIMKVQPVIASVFVNRNFVWGDNPPLRWATNNTKLVRSSRKIGVDTGNFIYAKIEAKTRKTDPFMALVASMTTESELDAAAAEFYDLPVIV
jgi:phage terminase large subunit-like protein